MKKVSYYLVALLVCGTVLLRLFGNFSSALNPGMNGGYYPVQVRSVIETGMLAYPDMPFLFYVEAGLVLVAQFITKLPINDIILFVTKAVDSVIPPLIIIPIFLLGKKHARSLWSELYLIMVSAFSGAFYFQLYGLSGEFTKNAVALVLMCLGCF